MVNPKRKGKLGEKEFRDLLTKDFKEFKTKALPTPLSGGADFKGDIFATFPLNEFHFEIKFQEKISIWKWINQVLSDTAGTLKYRVLAFRRSRSNWWVAMPYEDWAEIVKERAELREK